MKKEKIEKATIIVSDDWKFDFMKKIKELLEKTRDVKEIINEVMKTDLKTYEKEITKMIPAIVKDVSKVPDLVLNQADEFKALEDSKDFLAEKLEADIEIVKAQDSKEAKAKNAMPGKPAIVIS